MKVKVNIKDTQYTPSVEEGYVGGFYFKVDNPAGVKEAGVQYYNNTSFSTSNINFSKPLAIPNQGDGEFAGFVLTKTKYTNVRGYVITTSGDTIYTNIYTIIYAGNNGLYSYYGGDGSAIANADENGNYSGDEDTGENGDGVEVNSIGNTILMGISVLGVGLTVYTCEQDGLASSNCLISGALTFIPVGKVTGFVGKYVPKQMVINYASSTILGKIALSLGKYVDDLARLGYLAKIVKPIKSIDSHIFTKHSYESNVLKASKFLNGANIENIIKEGYIKSGRKFLETTSSHPTTGKTTNTIIIEVDMGRFIGKANKDTSKLRIIVDKEGNIFSAYPIDNFSIQ